MSFLRNVHINWFPGHMATAKRQIESMLSKIDIILEIRDARLPFSSSNPILDEVCKKKKCLVIFNKADLGNSNMQEKIRKKLLDDEGKECIFTCATKNNHLIKILEWSNRNTTNSFKMTGGSIMMVIGIPNVGKSSIINSLRRLSNTKKISNSGKIAAVGDKAGLTRRSDMIKINERPLKYVVDTPGVMIPHITSPEIGLKLALTGAIKEEIVDPELVARYMLYLLNTMKNKKYIQKLDLKSEIYDIDELIDIVLIKKLIKVIPNEGNTENTRSAAQYLLQQFRTGEFGHFTLDSV